MEFKKTIMGTLAILGLAAGVASAQDDNMSKEAIAERLKPVGELCLQGDDCGGAGAAPAAAVADSGGGGKSGEEIYNSVCMACHDTGAAGAPIRGEDADWADRVSKGFDTLLTHSTEGFNAMPARGGNPNLSDDEMYSATAYMVEPVMEVPAQEGGGAAATDEGGEQAASADSDTGAEEGQQPSQQSMAQNNAGDDASADGEQGGATEVAAAGGASGSDLPGASKIAVCSTCHGQDGKGTTPMYPNLAGQNATYMENALKAYRAGEREGGMSSVMTPMASGLSDEDIVDIAEYYSQQTP
ncbi:c-type cytochrome [Halomonas sp. PR-M31]|uniref:c-type cytochrome n=1 Tax=Halomonas sp. PR-M31 TaxID=1471202 RepID=UPI00069E0D13|nr:c-type cytochrome [Halomonas sp. PR-M31]